MPATYLSATTSNSDLCRLGKKKSKEFIVDLLWNAGILTESAEEEQAEEEQAEGEQTAN